MIPLWVITSPPLWGNVAPEERAPPKKKKKKIKGCHVTRTRQSEFHSPKLRDRLAQGQICDPIRTNETSRDFCWAFWERVWCSFPLNLNSERLQGGWICCSRFSICNAQQPKSIQEKAELSQGENLSPRQLDLSPKSSLLCLDFVVRWA